MKNLTCKEAKQIDLVDYLASFGHFPAKIRNQDYWYLSPLRQEKTPSFKVNRKKNVWYDHGIGTGGDFIDFGKLYHNCSTAELLNRLPVWLLGASPPSFSFHPHSVAPSRRHQAGEKEEEKASKIAITAIRLLADPALLNYLETRCIPVEIAAQYCKEVDFVLYNRQQTTIAFPNNAGGYELRSQHFKASSSPKAPTFFGTGNKEVAVFEGFFDFLSYLTINKPGADVSNFLILNSLAFFHRSKGIMEGHDQVNLYLDRNDPAIACVKEALQWDKKKFIDKSPLYTHYQDLNEWLIAKHHSLLQKVRIINHQNHHRKRPRI